MSLSSYSPLDVLLAIALAIMLVNQVQIFFNSKTQPLWHKANIAFSVSAVGALVLQVQGANLIALFAIVMEAVRLIVVLKPFKGHRP